MKSFNLFKNNTSWLFSLIWVGVLSCVLFLFSLIILALDIDYSLKSSSGDLGMGTDNLSFRYDVITYPILFVLAIFEVVIAIYFAFNIPSWWSAMQKSMGKRLVFNKIYVFSSLVLIIILILDSLFRFVYVVSYFNTYLSLNDGSQSALSTIDLNKYSIFGTFASSSFLKIGNFGFNPIILFLCTMILASVSLTWYFLQKKWFKSESKENAKAEVQQYYRSLEKNKLKKDIGKYKQKDLKRKIKTF